jgi:YVTN family beta-propeller protein
MPRTCFVALSVLVFLPLAPARAPDPDYQLLNTIKVGTPGGWDYLTVDARRLYVSHGDRVVVVDLDTDKVVGEVKDTPGIHGVAVAPKHKKGYTSNGGDSTVTVFDLGTLKETARLKVGKRPDPIILDPASDRVFTLNAGSMDATAIDAATDKVVGTVPLGGRPEFAAADGKGMVFVNIVSKNEVVAFDAKELKVKHRWPTAPGEKPVGLSMDPLHRRLFVTCRNEKMIVLDATNGKVLATLPIGKGTDASAFDPATGLAFSSNGDGTLTIVERVKGAFRVAATVKTQDRSKTMALDPKTHKVYLPAAKFKAGSRAPEAGSFAILVFGKK